MHSAFLYHAIRAGLDMGIVNAGMIEFDYSVCHSCAPGAVGQRAKFSRQLEPSGCRKALLFVR
jgi:hypothetical protein